MIREKANNQKVFCQQSLAKGFSLVEVMLAIAIFSMSVMGLSGGLIYGAQANILASHREQAVLYAFEGLEASENLADENFNNLIDGNFGLAIVNNSYTFSGSSDTSDIYERQISVSSPSADMKQITSRVSWSQNLLDQGQVVFTTYVANWK